MWNRIKKLAIPAFVCAAMLFAIVGFHLREVEVLFRDVSIALAALALGLRHLREE